jgi:Tfp pilus assembly ATPase PilU
MTAIRPQRVLETCVAHNASEVRFVLGRPVMLVIDRQVRPLRTKLVSESDLDGLVQWLRAGEADAREEVDDFEIGYQDHGGRETRFRVRMLRRQGDCGLVLYRTSEPALVKPADEYQLRLGAPSMN